MLYPYGNQNIIERINGTYYHYIEKVKHTYEKFLSTFRSSYDFIRVIQLYHVTLKEDCKN